MLSSDGDLKLKAEILNKLQKFDVRGERQYSEKYPKPFRIAAVLLPLKLYNGEIFILLTKRAKTLRAHASETAFPGGMVEDIDSSVIAAALREADEEVGLAPSSVEILAVLNRGITMTKNIVYPVVGLVQSNFQPKINPSEVEFAFFMPLKDFICEEKIQTSYFKLRFATYISRQITFEDEENEALVWGFTSTFCIFLAKIIYDQADYFALHVGSTNTGKISDCVEEYFNLCYNWILLHQSSKL